MQYFVYQLHFFLFIECYIFGLNAFHFTYELLACSMCVVRARICGIRKKSSG